MKLNFSLLPIAFTCALLAVGIVVLLITGHF